MKATDRSHTGSGVKQEILDRLHQPARLRAVVTGAVLLIGYAAVYLPLQRGISDTDRQLARENERLVLARSVEHLRAQVAGFQRRLPTKSDPNEWAQYLLAGLRQLPVKVVTVACDPVRDLGPYKAVALRVELEGDFADLNRFLGWLEANERLFRVDSLQLVPHRSNSRMLVTRLVILGVMG
jgi:hypothetical protein